MPPDMQKEQLQIIEATLSMQQEQDIIQKLSITDIEVARPNIEKVFKNFVTWLVHVTKLRKQALAAKSQLEELLNISDAE